MQIEAIDPAAVSSERVAAMHAVEVAALALDEPDRPPFTVEDLAARLAIRRDDRRALRWVAVEEGTVVGIARLALPDVDNTHTAFVEGSVHPECRRRGAGTALLAAAVAVLAAEGRRSVLLEAREGSPGAAFCDALGLEVAQTERRSLLRIAELDRAAVEGMAAAPHPGYRLAAWTDRCPDDALLAAYAAAKSAMNDAPTGTMDWTGVTYDVRRAREEERVARDLGEWRVVAAVHEATGGVAAFTELAIGRGSPRRALQEDTAVVPAHRGRGLGIWVKAEMLRRLVPERPDVEEILTGNDLTNDHMWRINERLGFRTSALVAERQGKVAELAARLGL